MTYSKY